MGNLRVGHWFNSGDLITLLPGLQHIYRTKGIKTDLFQKIDFAAQYYANAEHPIKSGTGDMVCMNREMFDMLKPLIEAQDYISSFNIWEGDVVDWDMKDTRGDGFSPIPYSDIHFWSFFSFPELSCDLSIPWIKAEHEKSLKEYILVNITERYRNPYITYNFLKNYGEQVRFIGTIGEWKKFKKDYGLSIRCVYLKDFYQMAQMLSKSILFIGNQSFAFHVADAMKIPRILEVCKEFPNTLPTGANGHAFVHQEALEFYVNKMMQ